MNQLTIYFDQQNNLQRLSLWRGKDLQSLYLEDTSAPDISGSIYYGKIIRTFPQEKSAFVECGLPQPAHITGTALKTGQMVAVRLQAPPREGKAWKAELCPNLSVQPEKYSPCIGHCLSPAPSLFTRLLADYGAEKFSSLTYATPELQKILHPQTASLGALSSLKCHISPHETEWLNEVISQLRQKNIPLSNSASLIIEQTAALWTIDINAPLGQNPLSVNLSAIKAALQQIRLRNLGGQIVLDTLKLRHRTDHAKLLNAAKNAAASDPRKPIIFGLTKMGLLEISRQWQGKPLSFYYPP